MKKNIEQYFTKDRLKKYKYRKNLYYYTVQDSSDKKGYNKTITVRVLLHDYTMIDVVDVHVNTAAYRGDAATAKRAISDIFGHKMMDGYDLASKNIKVINI